MPPRYETAGMTSSLSRRRLLSSAVAVAGVGLFGAGAGARARAASLPDVGQIFGLGNQPNPDCPGCTLSNPLPGQVTGGGADQYVQLQGMNADQGL